MKSSTSLVLSAWLFLFGSGIVSSVLYSGEAMAVMPSSPETDSQFMVLPDGTNMNSILVSGARLTLTRGAGKPFTAALQTKYEKIKRDSQTIAAYPVQWVLVDLDREQILAQSREPDRRVFGASVSKIFVAGTLLDRQRGQLSKPQLQLMSDMIVVSSNTAWTSLQNTHIGGGVANTGRSRVNDFTARMGYTRTRGYQGYWGSLHGNELTVNDTAAFLVDTYKANYPGAETLWKIMHTFRTGGSRGNMYLPREIYIGGKTGTFDGETMDPESGRQVLVRVRHQTQVFKVNGRQYGLSVLSNTGTDEATALLAGGLAREYAGLTVRPSLALKMRAYETPSVEIAESQSLGD